MYLKSIEVNGFKSFANRMIFKFDKGITGIVGPNGSGKSNVADAVRWVLGEQSAKNLRGSKMEDVIFSGTEARKPQGSAYVAITLDNSDHALAIDYTEVTVARRVYRSGESEYLINGNVSRLKDVNRLFFDTGIGKEGYSIIGQGKIDQILSEKPEARRELFDEAAGIVKYKKNKAQTEKQLETEHADLVRVNDLIYSLEDRVEPLRIQSETAKKYLELKESQKKLEVNSFLYEVEDIDNKLASGEEKKAIMTADRDRLQAEFDETKLEYEKLETELSRIEGSIEDISRLISDKKIENERLEGEKRVYTERIASFKKSEADIYNSIEKVNAEIKAKDEVISAKKAEEDEVKHQLTEKKKEYDKAVKLRDKTESEINSDSASIDKAKGDIIDFVREGSESREKVARYDAMLENIDQRRSELSSIYLTNKSEEERLLLEKERLSVSLQSVEDAIGDNTAKKDKTEAQLREATSKYDEIKNKINKYYHDIISLRSRHESLRNLTERYDGYGISIRKVMEKKSEVKGIIGVVSDIIKVDKKYETAIEITLGGNIQNIVTDNESTAKSMIEYLKKNKFGRATFLPVSKIRARGKVNENALREKGIIGMASDLVESDAKYQPVVDFLLGRTYVAEDIDTAIAVGKKYDETLRIVTLQGELINPGGSLSGGAFKNQSNLLGRKRELDDIEKEIGNTNVLYQKAKEEEASLKMKRESLKEALQRYNDALQKLSLERNTVALGLKQAEEKMNEISVSFAKIKKENSELDVQIVDISENKNELYSQEEEQKKAIEERREFVNSLEDKISKLRTDAKKNDEAVNSVNIELSSVRQRLEYINIDLERLNGEKKQLEDEKAEYEKKRSDYTNEASEVISSIENITSSIELNQNIVKEREGKLTELKKRKDDINHSHKEFFEKRDALSQEISGMEKAIITQEAMLEKYEEKSEELSNYMWEEYELTKGKAAEYKDESLGSHSSIKKAVSEVKAEIKKLGDVNVNAIEEYKEVSEKYEFLTSQRDDIVKAEDNLRSIISGLDKTMRDTFAEKFKDIQDMFRKVFRELFGGGNASLILVEDEDILEAGIIINAQPPGKKLQNMMMLSGGEKALTAISLLFAIQSLKPSPFCLLDEIEAALDDQNVKRFAKYLDKLTKHTQFIVITHRKGTMECADVLYGITMQEKGISTQVSVSMIEEKLSE